MGKLATKVWKANLVTEKQEGADGEQTDRGTKKGEKLEKHGILQATTYLVEAGEGKQGSKHGRL